MSFFGGGSKGGGSSETVVNTEPYAPAQPALNQIISEAGTIYNQGPTGAGYVAPTTQTMQGLAAQETMANAANQQILNTIQGQYTNPFLSPLIANAATDIYSNVAGQFSGAGRTPTSPLAQSTVIGQVAQKSMPLAFQQLERERARQLQTARAVPSLTAVGGELENIQRAQQLGPQAALSQYYNTVAPIAYGLPTRSTMQNLPAPNALGMAGGGAMMGGSLANMLGMSTGWGAAIGGAAGLLGGLL
tara:strand:- start:24 stop:761 length:738 start_codon:yes stop_codon:yes gene_type:complete